MSFLDVMHSYFRGERVEALYFILPLGVALLAFAAVTLRAERGAFAWGLAVPLALFGLVAIGTGAAIGLRTPGQVSEIGFLIDGFAERRARPYTQALDALAAENGP